MDNLHEDIGQCEMGNLSEARCTRCRELTADLFPCLWACPLLQTFWQRILCFTTHTISNLDLAPDWTRFGQIWSESSRILPSQKRPLFCIPAAAHKTILQTWLDPDRPTWHVFLDKFTFPLWMDWVNETIVQAFFDTWTFTYDSFRRIFRVCSHERIFCTLKKADRIAAVFCVLIKTAKTAS